MILCVCIHTFLCVHTYLCALYIYIVHTHLETTDKANGKEANLRLSEACIVITGGFKEPDPIIGGKGIRLRIPSPSHGSPSTFLRLVIPQKIWQLLIYGSHIFIVGVNIIICVCSYTADKNICPNVIYPPYHF